MKKNGEVDMVRDVVKVWINNGISPRIVMSGVHNAFVHGQILLDNGFDLDEDDKILGELFDGFDICQKAMKKLTS